MSKQHRQNAPEPPKASVVVEKPAEQTAPTPNAPVVTDAPEPPKASVVDAAGSVSELARSESDGSEADGEVELECPACIALNGECPCSVECFVAAGYSAELYAERFGTPPEPPAPEEPEGPPRFVAPEGKAHCKALKTCAVRGMPAFAGEEFWFEWHEAERLEGKGDLEILNK